VSCVRNCRWSHVAWTAIDVGVALHNGSIDDAAIAATGFLPVGAGQAVRLASKTAWARRDVLRAAGEFKASRPLHRAAVQLQTGAAQVAADIDGVLNAYNAASFAGQSLDRYSK
jgi:hypothetical protein